ncbi:MAG: hypothetical protein C1941_06525 [Prosthecochloris sp.]|nr:hypothetical protein [Prosthecochloris sp.]
MEKKTEPLKNIEARIDELENNIHEREAQLKNRAGEFKQELQNELSPEKVVKKYPLQSTGISLLFGILAGKVLRAVVTRPSEKNIQQAMHLKSEPSELKSAIASIGIDALRSGKDLAFNYLKYYLDNTIQKKKG